jgi:hypothetical protein
MLSRVEVYSSVGVFMTSFAMAADRSRPHYVREIEGLGPVAAQINTSPYATQDGVAFQSSKVEGRTITLKLGLKPLAVATQSVSKLRQDLYGMMPTGQMVVLRLVDDSAQPVQIQGYVETHEPAIFTGDPGVQITLFCMNPYFDARKPALLTGFNNTPIYTNPSGNAPTGFRTDLFVNRSITSVTLRNGVDRDMVYVANLYAGDVLSISTLRGSKFLKLTRAGSTFSVLQGLASTSSLSMEVGPKVDAVQVLVAGAADIPARVSYTPKYVGI